MPKEFVFNVQVKVTQSANFEEEPSFDEINKETAEQMLEEIFFGVPIKPEHAKRFVDRGETPPELAQIIDWGEHLSFIDTQPPLNNFVSIEVVSIQNI